MAEEVVHAYDAAKRHEYYLKKRQLKGRRPAKPKPPKKTRAQRQAERRKQQQAKIAALKSRLETLQKVLEAEVKKAKARSGVKPKTTETKKATSSSSNAPAEKLTAAQKAKKAKAEKKAREKDPDVSLDEQVKSLTAKIKTIQERIAKMRKEGSSGARKNAK